MKSYNIMTMIVVLRKAKYSILNPVFILDDYELLILNSCPILFCSPGNNVLNFCKMNHKKINVHTGLFYEELVFLGYDWPKKVWRVPFLAKTIISVSHHHKTPALCKQNLHLHRNYQLPDYHLRWIIAAQKS